MIEVSIIDVSAVDMSAADTGIANISKSDKRLIQV